MAETPLPLSSPDTIGKVLAFAALTIAWGTLPDEADQEATPGAVQAVNKIATAWGPLSEIAEGRSRQTTLGQLKTLWSVFWPYGKTRRQQERLELEVFAFVLHPAKTGQPIWV